MATSLSRSSWRRHNSTTPSPSAVRFDKEHPLVDEYNLEDDDDVDDLTSTMLRKARELFAVCDVESKGFITKGDMQRLTSELPLTADQLEDVFDSLDGDGNGYLTLYDFTDGFGLCVSRWTRDLIFFPIAAHVVIRTRALQNSVCCVLHIYYCAAGARVTVLIMESYS